MIVDNVQSASCLELADQIMTNSDGRPVSDSFMRVAAIELAKRIGTQEHEKEIKKRYNDSTGGEATPRKTWHSGARRMGDL